MQYENRQAPEGINVTPHNPVLHLLKLLAGAVIVIVLVVVLVNLFASKLGRLVPFRYEQALMEHVTYEFGDEYESAEMQGYLQGLADRLMPLLNVPEDVEIVLHHNADEVFNAYATFGGNVVFYSGLLGQLPHENALAMVVAHEIAHVVHRDPMAGLGGGLASMAALMALTGNTGAGTVGSLLSKTGMITQMKFSRDMERAADRAALLAVGELYGHVNGADELFKVLEQLSGGSEDDESPFDAFATTHPLHQDRIDAIADLAAENGWAVTGETTPLPDDFSDWLYR